jgi:hypothetical protein
MFILSPPEPRPRRVTKFLSSFSLRLRESFLGCDSRANSSNISLNFNRPPRPDRVEVAARLAHAAEAAVGVADEALALNRVQAPTTQRVERVAVGVGVEAGVFVQPSPAIQLSMRAKDAG